MRNLLDADDYAVWAARIEVQIVLARQSFKCSIGSLSFLRKPSSQEELVHPL